MQSKKIFFLLIFCLGFLLSANLASAQTCGDTMTPGNEMGRCLSNCDPVTEHQVSDGGNCIGQVCCAANPAGSSTTSNSGADKCTQCLKGCEDTTTYGSVEYNACSSSCARLCGGTGSTSTVQTTMPSGGSGSGLPVAPGASTGGAAAGGWSLGNIAGFGLPGGSVWGIFENILIWILGLFGIIGIIGFLISGIIYLTAAGDEDRMAYAKRAMQYSIIGVIVGLIGFVVIQAIDYALNAYSSF